MLTALPRRRAVPETQPAQPSPCRQANFVVRLQLRLRGLNLLFFVITVCLYTFLGIGSCK